MRNAIRNMQYAGAQREALCVKRNASFWVPIAAIVVLGIVALALAQVVFGNTVALVGLGVVLAALLVKYPEVCLLLFLAAGIFKAELVTFTHINSDLTVILGGILILGIVVRILSHGIRSVIPPRRLLVPFGLLAAIMVLSALSSPESIYGREKALRFATLTGLAAFAPFAVVNSEAKLRRLLLAVIGLGLLMVVLGRATGEGLSAFGSTHIATGRIIGLGLISLLYFLLRKTPNPQPLVPSWLQRLLLLATGLVLGFGFLHSGSRGTLVAILASLAFVGLLSIGLRKGRRWALAGALLLAGLLVGVTLLAPHAVDMMNRRISYTFSGPLAVTAQARVDMASAALDMFREHPLTGTGVGGFDLVLGYGDAARGVYPHNIFLEVGAELGLAGLAATVLLIGFGLWTAVRELQRARAAPQIRAAMVVLAIATYFLANAMFSGDLNDNRLLFAALGLCAALPRIGQGGPHPNPRPPTPNP